MKILKRLVCALVFVAGGALAQAPAPVDVEQRAAVKELLDAMNFKQVLLQMAGAMTQQMPQMLDQMLDGFASKGKLTPEQKAEARKLAQQSQIGMSRQMTEMYNDPQLVQGFEDVMARAYAKHFTTAEIKATTVFYTSPVGKKALTIMPQMMQETMPEIMAMMSPRISAMMETVAGDVAAQVENNNKAKSAPVTK